MYFPKGINAILLIFIEIRLETPALVKKLATEDPIELIELPWEEEF